MTRNARTLVGVCCLLAFLSIGGTMAFAQSKSDSKEEGHRLAERLCTSCHVVSPGTHPATSLPARSFQAIAKQPGQTAMRLAGAIIMPHPEMPGVPLMRSEVRAIVAYIMSLNTESTTGTPGAGLPVFPRK